MKQEQALSLADRDSAARHLIEFQLSLFLYLPLGTAFGYFFPGQYRNEYWYLLLGIAWVIFFLVLQPRLGEKFGQTFRTRPAIRKVRLLFQFLLIGTVFGDLANKFSTL